MLPVYAIVGFVAPDQPLPENAETDADNYSSETDISPPFSFADLEVSSTGLPSVEKFPLCIRDISLIYPLLP